MKQRIRFLCAATVLFIVSDLSLPMAGIQERARLLDTEMADAIRLVREQADIKDPLRATPMPDLRDDIIYLKTGKLRSSMNSPVPLINFYLVTLAPIELEGDIVVRTTVEGDGHFEWIVARDQKTKQSFLLKGSVDALAEFNRLVGGIHLDIKDPESAIILVDILFQTVGGQSFRSRVVGDEMKLQSVALEDFRQNFSRAKRRPAFDAWWNRISRDTKKEIVPPRAVPVHGGFEVKYFVYSRGGLTLDDVLVRSDGTIVKGKSTTIMKERTPQP
jgi:hypothetical protein